MIRPLVLVVSLVCASAFSASAEIKPIPRLLPPQGLELTPEQTVTLRTRLDALASKMGSAPDPDIEIFHKAVRFALLHREFYKPDHLKIADKLLDEADRRLEKRTNLDERRGVYVRGYRSPIDGSAQPYGLEVPEKLPLSKPLPLWVWLHGRGDNDTDLHFINGRMGKRGQFQPDDAIVLHVFGRQCIGFKSAGEIDVLDAIADVALHYPIDPDRVALMGFSMGGAGAWHLGAHYADRFACVHTGAGFAETKEYTNLKKEKYPPPYEQALWGIYDCPDYVRNLFNVPLLAYSGEVDKQIQSANVVEAALEAEGGTLSRIIGPKMGHAYDEDSIRKVSAFVRDALAKGRERFPEKLSLQTKTLRYPRMHWVTATGLGAHWKDSRIDANRVGANGIELATKNITALELTPPWKEAKIFPAKVFLKVDGQRIEVAGGSDRIAIRREGEQWKAGAPEAAKLRKTPGLQGPIDDIFLGPFLVVVPSGKSADPAVQAWVDFELAHFESRWRALFRGDLRMKKDTELTPDDVRDFHLILWGDRAMNPHVGTVLDKIVALDWKSDGAITVGAKAFAGPGHILSFIQPNPANPKKYVVLNSGPTFRENHDRTNSMQNPKLPDWVVIDTATPPDADAPGRIVDADFFDEEWQPK